MWKKGFFKLERTEPCGQGEVQKEIDHKFSNNIDTNDIENRTKFNLNENLNRPDGIYVPGTVEGVNVIFTADTGACKTVLSKKIFHSIPFQKRPKLRKTSPLTGASGENVKLLGKANFKIKLGSLEICTDLVVADIEDECLLGIDILQGKQGGSADILLSKGIINLRGVSIPCIQINNTEVIRRVTTADHCIIPAYCEAVIDVYIERTENDDLLSSNELIIEPSEEFMTKNKVFMANCLVDIKNNVTVKARVLNPSSEDISIKQDSVVGKASSFQRVLTSIKEYENPDEMKNFSSVRRLRFNSPETIVNDEIKFDKGDNPEVPPHLSELFNNCSEDLSDEEKSKVASVLDKYQDVFSKHEFDIGLTNLVEHSIDTGDAKPVKLPPRRVPIAFADQEKKIIKQLEEHNIIRKSSSPWSAAIVVVVRKDRKIRTCIDYRRLNSLTKQDAYPLPRTQDCLDAVAGSTYFSVCDVTAAYYQIPVKSSDIPKTAFATKYGLFEFTRLPFGTVNGSATCQRLMEIVLNGLQWQTCLIYLDDVIIFGKTFDEHISRLNEVLGKIKESGLKLKPTKCQFL